MPPHAQSRYLASYGIKDANSRLFLTARKPFRYDATLRGTRVHIAGEREHLWHIAYQYFKPFPNAEHLWWVIAEFQPLPIRDLTLYLDKGRAIYVPSLRVLQERILGF